MMEDVYCNEDCKYVDRYGFCVLEDLTTQIPIDAWCYLRLWSSFSKKEKFMHSEKMINERLNKYGFN